jgi:hypothetical protein
LAQQMKEPVTSDVACSGQNRATAQPRNRAIVQGVLLPLITLLPSLPELTQRFSSLHQLSPEFFQPLHGLIRRLKEFLQSSKDAKQSLRGFHQPLLGFIQRFFGFHQSLREANQSLSDANQPSFTPFLPKTTVFHHFSNFNHQLSTNH